MRKQATSYRKGRILITSLIRGISLVLMLCISSDLWSAAEPSTRLGTDTEAPPQRLALLIGNSTYEHLNKLKNPRNDVDQLEAKLKKLGFQTTSKYDLNHDDFVDAISAFQNRIEPGAIALFYYSGHGVQLGGMNYLIPVNMESGANAATVQGKGISLKYVRDTLSNAKLSLIILDACRTILNFQAKGPLEGLAPYYDRGALIAYAADEGQAASDNDTENVSLFTKHLVKELDKPDENLCQLFGRVREAVDLASGHVQFPFVYDGVVGEFVFNRSTTQESRKLVSSSSGVALERTWETIQLTQSDNPNAYAAFLALGLPSDSRHVKEAEERLSSLMSSTIKALGVVPLDSQAPPETVPVANQGERLFYEESYAEALKAYEKLLAARPTDAPLLYNYATCLLHLGRESEAISFFSKAVKQNSEIPWAYYNRGVAHHLMGSLKEAITDYTRALELRPNYAPGYNNLALAKRDAGDLAGAEQDVKKAITLDPHYAPSFFNNATILTYVGNVAAATDSADIGRSLTIPSPVPM
jgi:tetratricopeptide (TPR) repeat protein